MDTLTHLMQLARPQASLDVRCLLEGAFSFGHEQTQEGAAPFHLVLAGSCRIRTGKGRLLHLQAGDFVLFPGGGPHTVLQGAAGATAGAPAGLGHDGLLPVRRNGQGETELDLLCGHFVTPPDAARLLPRLLPDPLHVSLADASTATAIGPLVALIRAEAAMPRPGALAIVTALSQALFTLALRVHTAGANPVPSLLALVADPRMARSVQAMLDTPGRAWTIADLGALAAMSRATYARHFAQKAGTTVFAFLHDLRMALAADLLARTARSAADIGMEVGYQSEAAFGKAFAGSMGATPGRWRQRSRADLRIATPPGAGAPPRRP